MVGKKYHPAVARPCLAHLMQMPFDFGRVEKGLAVAHREGIVIV